MVNVPRRRTFLAARAAIFAAGLLVGGAAMYLFCSRHETSPPTAAGPREMRQGGYRLINPLLECEIAMTAFEQSELSHFEGQIQETVKGLVESGRAHSISIYFRDLNNGPWFGINERERFAPASLLKLPVLIAYLRIAQDDPSILKQSYPMIPEALQIPEYDFPNRRKLIPGRSYRVEELLQQMIVQSDNQAYRLLVRDPELHFARPFRDLKIPVPSDNKAGDFMDVKTYGAFFRILFNASYLSPEMSEAALQLLSQSEFTHGLRDGLPAGVVVAHKFGIHVSSQAAPAQALSEFHDCGIIYYPKRPYLLCVMSRGDDVAKLIGSIREVSKSVYDAVDEHTSR
jgi:beta-lactamase class A